MLKELETTLFNGKKVKEGECILFINSDGIPCEDIIRIRETDCIHVDTNEVLKKGTLYFWNNNFSPCDYKNADIIL
jgi:hypothetical protein